MLNYRLWRLTLPVLLLVLWSSTASAVVDIFEFKTDDDQDRYHKFIDELRCPKCKNQNLSGSNSPIAVDLRRELHRLIDEGKSNEEIVDFMVSRFGDFVLYRPPVQKNTYMLWAAPFVMAGTGFLVILIIVLKRRRAAAGMISLEEDEEQRFEELRKKIDEKNKNENND